MRTWVTGFGFWVLGALLAGAAEAKPPALTVLVVIDQLSQPELEAQRVNLQGKGLAELLEKGRYYRNAWYKHATTATGPGHALLGSGQYGRDTGIVSNDWYDYQLGRDVYCAEDKSVKPSTPTARPMSPIQFRGQSLAARVKKKYPKARVVGVSLKDRSAILSTGAGADAAYWYDDKARAFVSSSYYKYDAKLLAGFNAQLDGFLESHRNWYFSLAESTAAVCPIDDVTYHDDIVGKTFPHELKDLNHIGRTPYGNELLETLAEAVVREHDLGHNKSGQPDVLVVSFSAFDYVGHAFGPDSCEIADATARLDVTLGKLLAALRARVPEGRLAVVLSADHGSAPIPEIVKAQGGDAGRFNPFGNSPLRQQLESGAAAAVGYAQPQQPPLLIASFQEPCFYLDPKGPSKGKEAVARYWMKGWLGVQEGVQSVHIREDLEAKQAPESLQLAWNPDRGGDVCLILKPHWIWGGGATGTTHGQPQDYDMHVPVIVLAPGFAPGASDEKVSVAQVAPTLATLLGLPLKGYAEPTPLK